MTPFAILLCIAIVLAIFVVELVAVLVVVWRWHKHFVQEIQRNYKRIEPPTRNDEVEF